MKVSFCFETLEFPCDFILRLSKVSKISSYEPVSSQKYENGCRTKFRDFTVTTKGSSQNFARRGKTKELLCRGGGGGGRGLDPFRCAIDRIKKKKKSVTVSGPLCVVYRVKSLEKCSGSLP